MTIEEPVHPGRIVRGALEDLEVSVTAAAKALHVSRSALSNLINGTTGISPEMAVRLAKAIGGTTGFWMRMQMDYDLAEVERRADLIEVTLLTSAIGGDLSGPWTAQEPELAIDAPPPRARRPGVWREGSNSFGKTVKH